MKKLLLAIALCCPALLFAQSYENRFHRKHLFAKLSATLFVPKDDNTFPGTMGSLGLKINRYAAIGFSAGYFSFGPKDDGIWKRRSETKSLIPLGVDLTFTDFKAKKITHILSIQFLKPTHYRRNQLDTWQLPNPTFPSGWLNNSHETKTSGKSLFVITTGASLPVARHKLLLQLGYAQLTLKTNHFTASQTPSRVVHSAYKTFKNFATTSITLSFLW